MKKPALRIKSRSEKGKVVRWSVDKGARTVAFMYDPNEANPASGEDLTIEMPSGWYALDMGQESQER